MFLSFKRAPCPLTCFVFVFFHLTSMNNKCILFTTLSKRRTTIWFLEHVDTLLQKSAIEPWKRRDCGHWSPKMLFMEPKNFRLPNR